VLNRDDALPLWAQLEADLRQRLAHGEFEHRFPTDQELIVQYDVSRPTVRQAVASLVEDGLLTRHRGRGTKVAALRVEQSMPGSYSLAHAIAAAGQEETSTVLACGLGSVPPSVAAALDIEPGTEAVRVERVRFADGEPLAIDRSWLPTSYGLVLLDADLTSGSLYDILAAAGVRPTGGVEQIEPVIPASTDRRRLHLHAAEPAFRVHRLLRSGSTAMEDRVTIIRADRYRLTRTWGRQAKSAPDTRATVSSR
jgi:GntR family transcriptional regulator